MQAVAEQVRKNINEAIRLNVLVLCKQMYSECIAARKHIHYDEIHLGYGFETAHRCTICQREDYIIYRYRLTGDINVELSEYLTKACYDCTNEHVSLCIWDVLAAENYNTVMRYKLLCELLGRDVAGAIAAHCFIIKISFNKEEGEYPWPRR